jgi:endonuclease-3
MPVPCYNPPVSEEANFANEIHNRLMEAYGVPEWRKPLPPLDELISTILSQNTTDINRDRAFDSLRERFPTWEEVRDAETDEIVEAIRSAGLANQKGPRIQSALRSISEERGSLDLDFLRFLPPEDVRQWLMGFKGVGQKTAAIVMQFSLGMPAFPVDTHIFRLSKRWALIGEKVSADSAHQLLADLFDPDLYYAAHLNIIRHGREICHARRPKCDQCFLQELCHYYKTVIQGDA